MINFEGKKGVVLGVLNKRSIAADCANQLLASGADLICSYLPENDDPKAKRFVMAQKALPTLAADHLLPYDASDPASVNSFFSQVSGIFGKIDFLVHAIAAAPTAKGPFPITDLNRADFLRAIDISAFSLIDAAGHARELMQEGGTILTYSFLSSDTLVSGYELLGLCKATLEGAVRQMTPELASQGITINTLSAPPVASSAAMSHPNFRNLVTVYEKATPAKRVPSIQEVNKLALFLLSGEATAITGERLFADGGFHHTAVV